MKRHLRKTNLMNHHRPLNTASRQPLSLGGSFAVVGVSAFGSFVAGSAVSVSCASVAVVGCVSPGALAALGVLSDSFAAIWFVGSCSAAFSSAVLGSSPVVEVVGVDIGTWPMVICECSACSCAELWSSLSFFMKRAC